MSPFRLRNTLAVAACAAAGLTMLISPSDARADRCGSRSGFSISVGYGYRDYGCGGYRVYTNYYRPVRYYSSRYCDTGYRTYTSTSVTYRSANAATRHDLAETVGQPRYADLTTQPVTRVVDRAVNDTWVDPAERMTAATAVADRSLPVRDVRLSNNDYVAPAGSIDEAWNQLQREDYEAAQLAFARLSIAHPTQADPKVGFALASAALHEDGRAQRAFARAQRLDPNILDHLGDRPTARDLSLTLLADRQFAPSQATRNALERLAINAASPDLTMPDEKTAAAD